MSRHFGLSSELSRAIAKSPQMQKISFMCLAVFWQVENLKECILKYLKYETTLIKKIITLL